MKLPTHDEVSVKNDMGELLTALETFILEEEPLDGGLFRTRLNLLVQEISGSDKHYGFYQLCPKCDGQKTVSRPPGTPADVRPCSSWEASYPCDICKGEGVIPRPEIKNDSHVKSL